jgi:hypothetical protein
VKLPNSAVEQIPYLKRDVLGDRTLALAPLWDGEHWHAWIPDGNGGLRHMRPAECGEGSYVARTPARADDLLFPFLDFVWKHATWHNVGHWTGAIEQDVHQLAASLAKIDFLWSKRAEAPGGTLGLRRFIAGEVELLIAVCRSVLDELQEVMRALWPRITLNDPAEQKRKGQLKKSFADMVFFDNQLMTPEVIAERCRVPLLLAQAYSKAGTFVQLLRALRTDILHGGQEVPLILTTDRGFIIGNRAKHFADLDIWKASHAYNDHSVSLRPVLAFLITHTLRICNEFVTTLASGIIFPEDIAPGYHLLIRSTHGTALLRTLEVLGDGSPWWDD